MIYLIIVIFSWAFTSSLYAQYQPKSDLGKRGELVFTTELLSAKEKIRYANKIYKVENNLYYNEDEDGEIVDKISIIEFEPRDLPKLIISGIVDAYSVSDINKDGSEEFVVLSRQNGNWYMVEVFSILKCLNNDSKQWYNPIEGFLWYPGFEGEEGCSAELYWLAASKEVKVVTTNAEDEEFSCTDISIHKWK